MAKVRSRSLVIDASVARAAGPREAVHPTARNCRDFLVIAGEICHRMCFSLSRTLSLPSRTVASDACYADGEQSEGRGFRGRRRGEGRDADIVQPGVLGGVIRVGQELDCSAGAICREQERL